MEKIKSLNLKNIRNHHRFRQLTDIRNVGLYIFGALVLLVSYNGVKVIDTNYQLQKKIALLQQENDVKKLENSNLELKNRFLETDQYLELTARKQFARAAPGESMLLVPESVARKYIADIPKPAQAELAAIADDEPFYIQNLKAWWRFFSGKQ